jgi:uncharacterized membrane protein
MGKIAMFGGYYPFVIMIIWFIVGWLGSKA